MNIKIESLTKELGGFKVLSDVTMEFLSGNIYGVVGQNGSGKTMLLRAVAGLIRPTTGNIYIDGKLLHKDISFPPNLGLIIEKPELLDYLSGFENLKILAEIRKKVNDDKIKNYMEMFNLDPLDKRPVKKYSLGMKQKIAIIQAIMEDQSVLILDEAFNALDEETVGVFRELLLQYREEGRLVIITSHNKEDIDVLCDQTFHIVNGVLK